MYNRRVHGNTCFRSRAIKKKMGTPHVCLKLSQQLRDVLEGVGSANLAG